MFLFILLFLINICYAEASSEKILHESEDSHNFALLKTPNVALLENEINAALERNVFIQVLNPLGKIFFINSIENFLDQALFFIIKTIDKAESKNELYTIPYLINDFDEFGMNAFHYLASCSNSDIYAKNFNTLQKICEIFINHGGDVNLKNQYGQSILKLAVASKNVGVIFALKNCTKLRKDLSVFNFFLGKNAQYNIKDCNFTKFNQNSFILKILIYMLFCPNNTNKKYNIQFINELNEFFDGLDGIIIEGSNIEFQALDYIKKFKEEISLSPKHKELHGPLKKIETPDNEDPQSSSDSFRNLNFSIL